MESSEALAHAPGASLRPAEAETSRAGTDPLLDEALGTAHRRGWLVRRLLLVADVVALLSAFVVVDVLFGAASGDSLVAIGRDTALFAATLPAWIVGAKLYGLYSQDNEGTDHSTAEELGPIFHLVTVGVWAAFAAAEATGFGNIRVAQATLFWLAAFALIAFGRSAARAVARRRPSYVQNAIIVGAGDVGQMLGRKILNHPEYGINLLGFVDVAPKERRPDLEDLTVLGGQSDLLRLVRTYDVERVIVAFSAEPHDQVLDLIRSLKDLDVQIDIVPRLFEVVAPTMRIHALEGLPVVSLPPLRLSRSSRLLKRCVDICLSVVALTVLAPILAMISFLIKMDSRGPVLFRQTRMGRGDRTFTIYKFRTMRVDAEEQKPQMQHLNKHASNGDARMFKIPDDPRVTRVGRLLRRYSLDELPQLINVLKGDMSLVGPRPLILAEDEHVQRWARRRLDLKPGITGLWQVAGRNEIPFDEMVKLDYLYVTGWSLGGDLRLMARTLPAISRTRHVY
jgi:exopolysaccharide biosynthesis polyprenyl glycosylphosphotransferase